MDGKRYLIPKTDIRQVKGTYDSIFMAIAALILSFSVLEPVLRGLGFKVFPDVLRECLRILCHQKPDRCFFILGFHMSICGRCTAIYSAILLTRYFMNLVINHRHENGIPGRSEYLISPILPLALVLQMLIEWSLGVSGLIEATILSRFVSGFLFGIGWTLSTHIWTNIIINDFIERWKEISNSFLVNNIKK